jgi:hypothetical protein
MNKTKIDLLMNVFSNHRQKITFILIGAIPPSAMSAPEASTVNAQAVGINAFIEGVLNGDIGYLLTLISFFIGIIIAIFKKDWMPVFYGFFVAVAILVIPDTIKGGWNGRIGSG